MEKSSVFIVIAVSALTAVLSTSIMTIVISKNMNSLQKEMFSVQMKAVEQKIDSMKAKEKLDVPAKVEPVQNIQAAPGTLYTDEGRGVSFVTSPGCEKYLSVKPITAENGLTNYSVSLSLSPNWTNYASYPSMRLADYNVIINQFETEDEGPRYMPHVVSILKDRTLLIREFSQDGPTEQETHGCLVEVKSL